MCGIAGLVTTKQQADSASLVRKMTDVIAHRGPDDAGLYVDPHAVLGHRRLSIVDLAAGHQPMANESASLQIVYNGEIFNHRELRPKLEMAGHRYKTHCDTETIIHSYEEFGPKCLSNFRGMFAFAIWDKLARTLFCARDRLGKKPFYYFWNGEWFAFASEIKALLVHPDISADLEASVLPEYLAFGFVSSDKTLFKNIKKLAPGHHLTLQLSGDQARFSILQYWDVPSAAPRRGATAAGLIHHTRARVEDAVQSRLMSDVPLGVFLSGGVDSSAIAALVKRSTAEPVKTFSVGYTEERYSELGHAAQVARAIATDHHEVRIGIDDFFGALPDMIWHEDEPITWPSSISLHFVSQLASQQVKVVLTGEGSDELFGGYERYRWNLLNARATKAYSLLPRGLRNSVQNFVGHSSLLRRNLRRKLSHTFAARSPSLESLYLDNFYSAFDASEIRGLIDAPAAPVYGNYLAAFERHPHDSLLARTLYADQKTYLVQLLMKQDRMSMSASIESRVPLLDHELVEFASTIPDGLKIRGNVQKYIFKKAVEDLLPKEIVYRKKMGFPTPLRAWLRDERAKPIFTALLDRNSFLSGLIEQAPVEKLIQLHLAGQHDATDRIWRLMNLQLWGDIFISGRRDRQEPCYGFEYSKPRRDRRETYLRTLL